MRLAALALALASACSNLPLVDKLYSDTAPAEFSYAPLDKQDLAIKAALEIYGYRGHIPSIAWVDRLDCDGGYQQDGACVRGGYTDGHHNVYLARIYDWFLPEALAHEVAHYVQFKTAGKASHGEPWFHNGDGYQPCVKIQTATKAVAAILGL